MIIDHSIDIDEAVEEYGLAEHIAELDDVGLTVVPQATLRLGDEWFEQLRDALLRKRSNQAVHAMTPMEKADRGLGRGQSVDTVFNFKLFFH